MLNLKLILLIQFGYGDVSESKQNFFLHNTSLIETNMVCPLKSFKEPLFDYNNPHQDDRFLILKTLKSWL